MAEGDLKDDHPTMTVEDAAYFYGKQKSGETVAFISEDMAQIQYTDAVALRNQALNASVDFGKWTIATVFAVCAAVAVAARDKLDAPYVASLIVLSFVMIVGTGALTWYNWHLHARHHQQAMYRLHQRRAGRWCPPKESRAMPVTYYFAIGFACVAVGCATAVLLLISQYDATVTP